jgi:DNA-binding transcriptional ArsR family regulator
MPVQNFASRKTTSLVNILLEPVANALVSLLYLHKANELSGLGDWVYQTAEAMSTEERLRNDIVMNGLYFALVPERSWSSFPAYLNHLGQVKPEALRDRILDAYAEISHHECDDHAPVPYDRHAALASFDVYFDSLVRGFGQENVDAEIERQAYQYVIDPPAMQKLIITHLGEMWDKYLSVEWERVKPMLRASARAFSQIDFSQMSKLEAAEWITDHEFEDSKSCKQFQEIEQFIFVPNAHIGPYIWRYNQGGTSVIIFGARLPKGAQVDVPDLSRAEILVRLGALADDNRLRILKHISEHGEQRSQEIIDAFDLSQSATSRHLMQLSATGFLHERRCEGAKCYRLNPERVHETMQAIESYLLGDGAELFSLQSEPELLREAIN